MFDMSQIDIKIRMHDDMFQCLLGHFDLFSSSILTLKPTVFNPYMQFEKICFIFFNQPQKLARPLRYIKVS